LPNLDCLNDEKRFKFRIRNIFVMEHDLKDEVVVNVDVTCVDTSWMPGEPQFHVECDSGKSYDWIKSTFPKFDLSKVVVVDCKSKQVCSEK
jgi:hypothetical protein